MDQEKLANRYLNYDAGSNRLSRMRIKKNDIKSLDAHKMLLSAYQSELETITIRDLELVHSAVEKGLGTANKVLKLTSKGAVSKFELPEVFDAMEIAAVTPQLVGNMIRMKTSRAEYDQLKNSITISEQEKIRRCTFEIPKHTGNLAALVEFKDLLSSLYAAKGDFMKAVQNMNDLNTCFEDLCGNDTGLDKKTLDMMSAKMEDASTYVKNMDRLNELNNIRDAYRSQKKEFAFETLALGLEKGLDHGSELVFDIGESVGSRLLMGVGTALPVLSVAKKVIVIKQKVNKLKKNIESKQKIQ